MSSLTVILNDFAVQYYIMPDFKHECWRALVCDVTHYFFVAAAPLKAESGLQVNFVNSHSRHCRMGLSVRHSNALQPHVT
mmetsp:Transcript_85127/g.150569  ORF Transcript_85127/g.150569 Transcript_85127/m.150569 type:complete len:80 (-) Transcript_85127:67-306(-)